MPDSRARRTRSLIEVTRILMKQGRQYGTADHNVRETIRGFGAEALAVRIPPLTVIGVVCRLSDSGHAKDPGNRNRICRYLQRKLKFHLGGKRGSILFIRDIEVRHDAQYPLMFLGSELLSS